MHRENNCCSWNLPKSGIELDTSSVSSFLRSFFPVARGLPAEEVGVVEEDGEDEGGGGGQSVILMDSTCRVRSGGRGWSGRVCSFIRRTSL